MSDWIHPGIVKQQRRLSFIQTKRGIVATCFFFMLLVDGLAAYSLGGIPLPWFAYLFGIFGLFITLPLKRVEIPPGTRLLVFFIAYAWFVQLIRSLQGLIFVMPALAPTPYQLFIITRFVVLIGFVCIVIFTYKVAVTYGPDLFINILFFVMLILVVAAIYIYMAQIYGLWEPPRTRLGTGGQDFLRNQMSFSYMFHRALGTFREPSHLAEWLISPMLLLLVRKDYKAKVLLVVGGITLVLTGSLLGVLMFIAGWLLLAIFAKKTSIVKPLLISAALLGGGLLFAYFVFNVDFLGVLLPRMVNLFEGGVTESNRAYVYEYLKNTTPPFFGYGLGNANLIFSKYSHSALISSHSSLFVNLWFSLGPIGIGLMAIFLFRPLVSRYSWKIAKNNLLLTALLASLGAWMVAFVGHVEELPIIFAVIYGLFWAQISLLQTVKGNVVGGNSSSRERNSVGFA